MERTYKLFYHESYHFEDGTTLERDEVTVRPYGEALNDDTIVWADVDDDSCLYTVFKNRLWPFEGTLYKTF